MDVEATEDGGVVDALLWAALNVGLDVRAAARAARAGPQLRESSARRRLRWREQRAALLVGHRCAAGWAVRLWHAHPVPPLPAAALEAVRHRRLTHRQFADRRTLAARVEVAVKSSEES